MMIGAPLAFLKFEKFPCRHSGSGTSDSSGNGSLSVFRIRGTELAREAQVRQPELKVLLVSGFSEELLDTSDSAPPSWELLAKPYSREELRQAIARALSPDPAH